MHTGARGCREPDEGKRVRRGYSAQSNGGARFRSQIGWTMSRVAKRQMMAGNPYAPVRKLDGQVMQQVNRALVLNLVRTEPPQSRIDLVRRTGLSPATITDIVDHLLREGLIRDEGAAATGTIGRRPSRLAFNPDARLALGI